MASSSYDQISLSSASTSLTARWDVFISFRGVDTRYRFTDHLFNALDRNGIQTFMDDPELRTGEVIADALVRAIRESKIYVVVFSENYASSRWCLDELVEIKSMGRLIIPVFYNIEPSVVRHQLGSFNEAFEVHETRFDMDRLATWRIILSDLADLSGHCVGKNMSEAGIINEIVDEIIAQINPRALDVAKYPVGLVARVKSITTLLSSDAKCVIRIGIYGMGGVGKTTLAKALYNQLLRGGSFKGSSFVANIREVSETTKGLVSLQQQIIDDVLKSKKQVEVHNVEEGTKFIRDRICSAKILLLIDDIYDLKQYESLVGPFASGSVVIITTRDEEVLDRIDVKPIYRYKVNELDDAESLALFNQHAFGNAEPNQTLKALTEEILHLAGGIPMALEVFGSNLSTRSVEGWTAFIETMKRKPNSNIQEKLIISLNALEWDDPMLKKIFIDIACCFIGWEKEVVVNIMDTYYSNVNYNIDILRKRCLLTFNNKDELRMHDLLREMGREIARNNSHDEPGKYSRLWESKDIREVLKKRKGTKAIECIISSNFICQDALEGVSFASETFQKMSKLRFLHLDHLKLTGKFEQTFEDLRWLRWVCCPLKSLPSEFYPEKLVILELPSSKMRTMWEMNMVTHVFENLKTLNMSYSQDLSTTPDFEKLPCLETLNLKGCQSLEEVQISIGCLKRLVSLDLHGCVKLRSLPDTICELRALKVLNVDQCSSLGALPLELGNIESLTVLDACGIDISYLPDSIGCLSKLVKLRLSNNMNLESLPNTIGNLRALEVLSIDDCICLGTLPVELGNIESLTRLNLSRTIVFKLPDSIGHLTKLIELSLLDCKYLETLPETVYNLRSLKILNIFGCEQLEILPDQLWKITSLRELDARDTTMLRKLPDIIKSSHIALSLQKLSLSFSGITALPFSISQLSNLEHLDISECSDLLSIAGLPPNLKYFSANGCKSLESLPNLSKLKELETLDLTDCRNLTKIQGCEELASIRRLHLGGCNSSLANTFTERFVQIYSEFGHYIEICAPEFPDWIPQGPQLSTSITPVDLRPKMCHSFLGLIICFKSPGNSRSHSFKYSLKTTASNFEWSDKVNFPLTFTFKLMVIVPKSIFSVKDSDDRIEVTAHKEIIHWIHPLYRQMYRPYVTRVRPECSIQ